MTGRMQTGFRLVQQHLAVIAHPDFANRVNGNQRPSQGRDTAIKPLDRTIINGFKNIEIARTN